jgi:hypothetical protein
VAPWKAVLVKWDKWLAGTSFPQVIRSFSKIPG